MKFYIETLGCKVNAYESEVIKNILFDNSYVLDEINPDIIIINTCTVTNQSDAKSRKVIRSLKRKYPNAITVVCGCSAEHHKEELLPLGIDILIGNKDKTKIVDYIKEFKETNNKIIKFYDLMHSEFEDMALKNYYDHTRAFVKIQDGCNNFCSYCIIPYMRGNIRNKDFDIAVKEITDLVNNGFKEIVLTGIHTGSYNRLVELIEEISKLEDLERIRISSIEITELDEKFMNELKNNSKICDHLHIPIQSGANNTLRDMHRKYDIAKYKEIIHKIREIRSNINITTDLIVGFPTETAEDAKETLNNLKDISFGKIHTFPFSLRNGTYAEKLKNIVTDQEKTKRVHEVLELSDNLEHNYYLKFLNKEINVLIEEVYDTYSVGHTSNYMKVIINEPLIHNKDYMCIITDVNNTCVIGKIVK